MAKIYGKSAIERKFGEKSGEKVLKLKYFCNIMEPSLILEATAMTALKRMLAAMTILALTLALCAPAGAEGRTAYAGTDDARVYNEQGETVGTLPMNAKLEVTAVKGDICRISYKGRTGYMRKADLVKRAITAAEPEAETMNVTAYVSRDGATVYTAKGKAAGALDRNTQVTVTAVKDDVCRISYKGRTGFMRKADLSRSAAQYTETAAQATEVNKTAYVNKDGAKVYNGKGKVVGSLDLNTQVTITAVNGRIGRISLGGKTGYMNIADLSARKIAEVSGPGFGFGADDIAAAASSATPAHGTAHEMDWWTSGIQTLFPRGGVATVTDVETGLAWKEQRYGGTNHADVQPLTAADTAALKQAYGGTWSWTRRAIFVTIGGVNYAASMNGMPHGGGSIKDNDFSGHHCIHFTNSRTHGSNRVCQLHQAAIQKALQAKL